MALLVGSNGAYIHELTQSVFNNTQFRISAVIKVISYGTGPSEILALSNSSGTFQLVTAAGVRGCAVHMDSAGALTIVSNNTSAVQTTPGGITLALGATYYVALNYSGSPGVYSLAVRNISTVGAATVVTAHTQNLLGSVFRLNTKTGESGVTHVEALNCEPATAAKNHNIQWIIPEAHATGRPPSDRQRYGFVPAHRGYYNNALLALGDSVDENNARFYQNNTNYALVGLVRAKLRAAKHHRRIRRTVGNWAYSSGGTRSGAPPASISATRSIASTAVTNTGAPSATLGVSRAAASTGNTTTTAAASVGVQRAVSNTANTTTTAAAVVGARASVASTADTTAAAPTVALSTVRPVVSSAGTATTASASVGAAASVASSADTTTAASTAVGAAASVASTANTVTTGTAQAGNGVVSQAATAAGAPDVQLSATYPVESTGSTTTSALARLVAPIASAADTTTSTSAAISTSRVVASVAGTTTAASAAIGASAAVSSAAATSTAAAVSVGRFQDVVSTSATLSGATALALAAARSISSVAGTNTGAPGAGVGVLVVAAIATNYAGASNTFCRAPDAKITVGFTPAQSRRKREWPYHPR